MGSLPASGERKPFEYHAADVTAKQSSAADRIAAERTAELLALEHERRLLLARLLGRLRDGVISVDPSLRIEFANDAARAIIGEAIEGDELRAIDGSEHLRTIATQLFEPGAAETEHRISVGARSYAVLALPGESLSEGLLVFTDVSEHDRRERAEREFITNAAHELQSPLAAITSAAEVLKQGAKDDPVARERFIDHIDRECARLGRLARALLVLARAQTGAERPRAEVIPLCPLLNDLARDVRAPQSVRVEVICDDDTAVLANRELLEQALSNLAGNAIKHTESGAILFEAGDVPGERVRISVRDTGRGISRAEQERVFDRFYQSDRQQEGFGLGLAIVAQAVEALDGELAIDSEPGRGTTVSITLPGAKLVTI